MTPEERYVLSTAAFHARRRDSKFMEVRVYEVQQLLADIERLERELAEAQAEAEVQRLIIRRSISENIGSMVIIDELKAEVGRLTELLHKADGMANEINILTREVACVTEERDTSHSLLTQSLLARVETEQRVRQLEAVALNYLHSNAHARYCPRFERNLGGECNCGCDDLRQALTEPPPSSALGTAAVCVWSQEDEDSDTWYTQCGKYFCLVDYDERPDWKFCCYCGKPATFEAWKAEDEEDDEPSTAAESTTGDQAS